jgi:hypothetical protein
MVVGDQGLRVDLESLVGDTHELSALRGFGSATGSVVGSQRRHLCKKLAAPAGRRWTMMVETVDQHQFGND